MHYSARLLISWSRTAQANNDTLEITARNDPYSCAHLVQPDFIQTLDEHILGQERQTCIKLLFFHSGQGLQVDERIKCRGIVHVNRHCKLQPQCGLSNVSQLRVCTSTNVAQRGRNLKDTRGMGGGYFHDRTGTLQHNWVTLMAVPLSQGNCFANCRMPATIKAQWTQGPQATHKLVAYTPCVDSNGSRYASTASRT
jgi:hypothetical protein